MSKYYYLVASLPYLRFDAAEIPIEKKIFLDECKKWLSPPELDMLNSATIGYGEVKGQETGIVKNWKTFNAGLIESLAKERSGGAQNNNAYMQADLVKDVFVQGTPLLMEKRTEQIRWQYLDDNEKYYFFDLNTLIIYYLKLQILERLARFDKDEGEKLFYEACEVKETRE